MLWFNSFDHINALEILMAEPTAMKADAALAELTELTGSEAMGRVQGFARSEVLGLNSWQIRTLAELKDLGLNADDLRKQPLFDDLNYQDAARYLMRLKQPPLDAKAAMDELHGLSAEL